MAIVLVKTIGDLAGMEVKGTDDLDIYAQSAQVIAWNFALEIHMTGSDVEVALIKAASGASSSFIPVDRVMARRLARQTTSPLKDAAQALEDAGHYFGQFHKLYQRNYAELVEPKGTEKSPWKWERV